jgi:hypothetical protein
MKIYTEKQVLNMLVICRDDDDLFPNIKTFNDVLKTQTPIQILSEVPDDIEIFEEADKEKSNLRQYYFRKGAKWMRDKIQGGNK